MTENGIASGHTHHRLHQGALGIVDIAASTMANIAPAMSFFFGFGFLVYTAGLASPLTIVAAVIAIAFLGNTVSEFTKVIPSTGGFITFVGKTFGARTGVTTALMTGAGYIAAMASVIAISGGFFQIGLQYYKVKGLENVPWIVWTVLFVAFSAFMLIRGIKISTRLAGLFFAFEIGVMILVSLVTLIKYHQYINLKPFTPSYISGGLKGLAAGFPLAIYLFIGWENSAALAEETDNPRENVPKAVFASIGIMAFAYLLFAYSTIVGSQDSVATVTGSEIPFLSVAHGVLAGGVFLAFLAGFTSTIGSLISGTNSQARLIFNAGREGLLPKFMGAVNAKRKTPVNAMMVFLAIGLGIITFWGIGHIAGGHATSGSMSPTNFFFEVSTFGTSLVLLVYLLANLALPFYIKKFHPEMFNAVKHVLLPSLGIVAILVPMYYLVKPGQPTPYNWFPYAALIYVVAAAVYAFVIVGRDPLLGERIGSIVADE